MPSLFGGDSVEPRTILIAVRSATQVEAFIPFTALPKSWAGKIVELRIRPDLKDLPEGEDEDVDPTP
jgi:hypothetical protein